MDFSLTNSDDSKLVGWDSPWQFWIIGQLYVTVEVQVCVTSLEEEMNLVSFYILVICPGAWSPGK